MVIGMVEVSETPIACVISRLNLRNRLIVAEMGRFKRGGEPQQTELNLLRFYCIGNVVQGVGLEYSWTFWVSFFSRDEIARLIFETDRGENPFWAILQAGTAPLKKESITTTMNTSTMK